MAEGREAGNIMGAGDDWEFAYRTNDVHGEDFLARVRSLVDEEVRDRPLQVLEVGCGDGGKSVRLADCWPRAHFTGVDVSEPSIRQAEQLRLASPARERLRFLRGNYLTLSAGRYDLILADSVLQWLPGPTDRLFGKLADELNPGGLLLFSMPYSCLYNTLLTSVRRTLRLLRSKPLDRLLLTMAGGVHGQAHSPEFLRERLNYLYILPQRTADASLEKNLLARHRLAVRAVAPYVHASLGQYKHRLWCFRRETAAAVAA